MILVYEEVLARFIAATGSDSKADLARRLGIAPSSITKWQKTGAVPLKNIISSLPKEKAIWVIYGGDPVDQPPAQEVSSQQVNSQQVNSNQAKPQDTVPLYKYEALQKEYYKLQGALENCKEMAANLTSELSKPAGTFVTPRERATQ